MSKITRFLYAAGAIITAVSLPTSRGFVTVGIVCIILAALIKFLGNIRDEIATIQKEWRSGKAKPFLALTLPFFPILVSGLYSTDTTTWMIDTRLFITALLVPLAALIYGKIKQKEIIIIQVLFLLSSLTGSLYSLSVYLLNSKELNESLAYGHHLPSLLSPLSFSLVISFAILVSITMYYRKQYLFYKSESYFYFGLAIFLFIFQYIFAVRTGIVITFASILLILLYLVLKNYRPVYLLLLSALVLFPVLSYQLIPSFKTKVGYVLYDWGRIDNTDAGDYSDANRLLSYKLGWGLFKQAPILGHGGDTRQLIKAAYKEHYPEVEKWLQPHNQFLTIAMKTGIIGLVVLLFSMIYPLRQKRWQFNILILIISLQIFLSCMVENTLGSSLGIAHYLFWLCLYLLEWKSNDLGQ